MNHTVIALGFFDGVHRGHGALLSKTVERARELGVTPAVFTFDRPPKEVVTGKPVYLINSPEDRRDLRHPRCHPRPVRSGDDDHALGGLYPDAHP